MARRGNNKGRKQSRAQPVQVMDEYAGADGVKFDRVLTQLQNSHGQVTLCLQDAFNLSVQTTASNAILAASQIKVFDDFVSMASQFETYRVKRIRFDIYDINPALGNAAFWSTFHDQYTSATQYVPSQAAVVDGTDSQMIAPGTGKISLFWTAKGTLENGFQNTTTPTGTNIYDYGGLRYSIPAGGAVNSKYYVVVKAIVDFRGRY